MFPWAGRNELDYSVSLDVGEDPLLRANVTEKLKAVSENMELLPRAASMFSRRGESGGRTHRNYTQSCLARCNGGRHTQLLRMTCNYFKHQ